MIKTLSLALVLFAATAFAAFALDDLVQTPTCKYCGIERQKFSHSRMHVDYEDG